MDLLPIGRAAIRAREGERLTAYRDSKGILTISVGVTTASGLITVTPGLTLTAAQSDALFSRAAEKYAAPVRAALTRPVPQPFFDACVSLAYNIGAPGFARSSVCRLANAGDLKAAVEAFLMWDKPAEIISRRQGERDQAALASYAGARVYARRGDRAPVSVPAPAPSPSAPAPTQRPAIAAVAPAPAAAAPSATAAPVPTGLLARLRAAFPLPQQTKA